MSTILLLIALLAAGHIKTGEACPNKLHDVDLLFIVDASDTICDGDESCPAWDNVRRFMHKITESLTIGPDNARVAMVQYAETVSVPWNLDKYKDNKTALLSAIDNVARTKGELQGLAIINAQLVLTGVYNKLLGDRLSAPNIAIVITDGIPEYKPWVPGLFSALFQLTGVKFFLVCIKPGCRDEEAIRIASRPMKPNNETYYFVDGYSAINTVSERLSKQICAMAEACYENSLLGYLGGLLGLPGLLVDLCI